MAWIRRSHHVRQRFVSTPTRYGVLLAIAGIRLELAGPSETPADL